LCDLVSSQRKGGFILEDFILEMMNLRLKSSCLVTAGISVNDYFNLSSDATSSFENPVNVDILNRIIDVTGILNQNHSYSFKNRSNKDLDKFKKELSVLISKMKDNKKLIYILKPKEGLQEGDSFDGGILFTDKDSGKITAVLFDAKSKEEINLNEIGNLDEIMSVEENDTGFSKILTKNKEGRQARSTLGIFKDIIPDTAFIYMTTHDHPTVDTFTKDGIIFAGRETTMKFLSFYWPIYIGSRGLLTDS
jgi:hypothetical protein